MKTIIAVLIFLSFLQTSVLPLNLVLIVVLVRSFVKVDSANLILAFVFGMLLSHLQNQPAGLQSLVNIILVEAVYLWKRTPFSHSIWTILPVVGVLLVLSDIGNGILNWPKIILEIILILPIYLTVRFWEERFIVRREIKLKV